MLRPSVVCNVCIVAKRCVLVQKVLSLPIVSRRPPRRLYEDLICTKINDLDLCLEVEKGHVKQCVTFATKYLCKRQR